MASLIIGGIISAIASGIATKSLFDAGKGKKVNIFKNIKEAVTNPFNYIPVAGPLAGIASGVGGEVLGQGIDALSNKLSPKKTRKLNIKGIRGFGIKGK